LKGKTTRHPREIKNEFPSVGNRDFKDFKEKRGYLKLPDKFWS